MAPDNRLRAFIYSILDQLFWARGGEEIVGPLGPLVAGGFEAPWFGPSPEPWRLGGRGSRRLRVQEHAAADPAVHQLIQGARIKEVAARLPEGQQRTALVKAASDSIKDAIDELCPPPRVIPWPKPHWAFEVVSELARVAASFADGAVRDELLNAAAEIARRGLEDSSEKR